MRATIFLFCFVFFSCSSQEEFLLQEKIISEQDSQAQLELFYDKTDFLLSEVWSIKFVFTYPAVYQFREKYLNFLDYQPLLLLTEPIEKTNFDSQKNLWKKSFLYIFESPNAGKFLLQKKEFILQHLENAKKISLIAPTITMRVSTNITPGSKFQKIERTIEKESYIIYYSLAVLLVLLVIAVYFWKRKIPQKKEVIVITKWALNELKKLKKNNLITTQEIKHYHLELSRILRMFFEKQFFIPVLTKTREEFLQEIAQNKDFQKNYQRLLQHYLEMNDLVKFANYRTSEKHNEEIFELVKKIVTFYHTQQKK